MRLVLGCLFLALVVLLLRSTALPAMAARGVVLDALVFAVVLWSLRHGDAWGATFGFFLGLAADLDAAHLLGRHALALTLIGYAVGRLRNTFVRDSTRTHVVLLLVATAAHQLWSAVFDWSGAVAGAPFLLGRLVLAVIMTTLVGSAVFAVLRRILGRGLFHATGSSV